MTTAVRAGGAGRYLRGPSFWVEYDGIAGLEDLHPAQQILPALANLLPLAFALGAPIELEYVDATFAAATETLAKVFGGMYPSFAADQFRLIGERSVLPWRTVTVRSCCTPAGSTRPPR